MKPVFTPSQIISTQCLYAFISQLTEEQRKGAVAVLSILMPMTEDGYVALNQGTAHNDFYTQCFDVLLASALALKLLSDDGLIPDELPSVSKHTTAAKLTEASLGISRVEQQLTSMVRISDSLQ